MWRLGLIVALVAGHGRTARADVEWEAPAGCPDQAEVRDRVAEAAGDAELADVLVRAVALRAAGAWRAEVQIGDELRVLTGGTCDEVAAAAALVIGLALRRYDEAETEPVSEETAEVVTTPATESVRVESRAVERPAPVRVVGFATAGGEIGTMPSVAAAAAAGLEIAGRVFAARLAATFATSGVTPDADAMYSSAHMTRLAAAGRLCASVRPLSVCGGLEVGRMAAAVASADDRDDGAGLWVAAAAGAGLGVRLAPALELAVETELVVPLAYPRFSVNGSEGLAASGVVGGRVAAAVRVQFR